MPLLRECAVRGLLGALGRLSPPGRRRVAAPIARCVASRARADDGRAPADRATEGQARQLAGLATHFVLAPNSLADLARVLRALVAIGVHNAIHSAEGARHLGTQA
jgi:hypothetical protein